MFEAEASFAPSALHGGQMAGVGHCIETVIRYENQNIMFVRLLGGTKQGWYPNPCWLGLYVQESTLEILCTPHI